MTDEELDALVSDLRRTQWGQPLPNQAAAAIMAIRAQLADANARADRAEAERAAQIEVDAEIANDFHRRAIEWAKTVRGLEKHIGETDSSRIATAIRAQPHDRTALDRMLAEAREKTLREAIEAYPKGIGAILALIEKPDAT